MLVIVGWLLALAGIFGGYAAAGGHLAALFQPLEVVMIGGGAMGAFVAANNMHTLKHTVAGLASCFKGSKYSRAFYMELLALLFEHAYCDHGQRDDQVLPGSEGRPASIAQRLPPQPAVESGRKVLFLTKRPACANWKKTSSQEKSDASLSHRLLCYPTLFEPSGLMYVAEDS